MTAGVTKMAGIITATVVSHDLRFRRLAACILATESDWACTVMRRGGKRVQAVLPSLALPGASLAGQLWHVMRAIGQQRIEFALDSTDALVLACGPTLALQRARETVSAVIQGRHMRAVWRGDDASIAISKVFPSEVDAPGVSLMRAVELAARLEMQGGCAQVLTGSVASPPFSGWHRSQP